MVPAKCLVIRMGRLEERLAGELVVGDLIFLRSGDKVPADLRLVYTREFRVDNSSITGESEPQERTYSIPSSLTSEQNPLESKVLAFSGTMAVNGEALGIAIRLGDHSMLGQIASMACGEQKRPSQLSGEIGVFVKKIAAVAIATAIVFFIFGMAMRLGVGLTFSFAIGIFVAFVPQGLPATVTLLLSIAAKRLSKKQVLVKDLHGVETLGGITLLATDKTGTLTQNRMSVVGCWLNSQVTGMEGMAPESIQETVKALPNGPLLGFLCALCTRCQWTNNNTTSTDEVGNQPDHQSNQHSNGGGAGEPVWERKLLGDATEVGLLKFAGMLLGDRVVDLPKHHPKIHEIPFNSANKWQLSVHGNAYLIPGLMVNEDEKDGESSQLLHAMFVKGAPERVLAMCSWYRDGNVVKEIGSYFQEAFQAAYEHFAGKGQRVLACAYHTPNNQNEYDHVGEPECNTVFNFNYNIFVQF